MYLYLGNQADNHINVLNAWTEPHDIHNALCALLVLCFL